MTDQNALSIRVASAGDAPMVRELVRAAYAKWVPLLGREPKPMQVDYEQAVRAHRIDLFDDKDQTLALIETFLGPDHLFIENVAVTPTHQGRGLGRVLLAHAERLAAEAGLAELRLLTNGKMAANITLYLSVGYRVDREEPFMDGRVVYMSKAIPAVID